MKFQNYILTVAICSLFACSNEDDPIKTLVIEPDATLSLVVDNGETSSLKMTKANEVADYGNLDKDIYSLTLAVFNQGAYEGIELGVLVACKTATSKGGGCNNVEDVEVHSGPVEVMVLGNLSEFLQERLAIGTTKLSDITDGSFFANLDGEESRLTMSSAIHSVNIQTGKVNCMGYSNDEIKVKNEVDPSLSEDKYISLYQSSTDKPGIKLYRNVARIQFKSITLSPLDEYSTDAKFILKSLFVANAKSKTILASTDEWGKVEWTPINKEDWMCGQFAEEEGVLKNGEAIEYNNLLVELEEITASFGKKDAMNAQVNLDGPGTYSATEREQGVIGKTFYVYENADESEEANHTLLVLFGTYTYTPKGETTPLNVDGYYAVTVNKPGEGKLEGVGNLTPYIKRNYNYSVNVTIKTPGAKKAYDPEVNANLSTSVKVEPWNVKNIHEDVE